MQNRWRVYPSPPLLALIMFGVMLSGAKGAQTEAARQIEDQLKEAYVGKIVTLRGFVDGSVVKFDSQGELIGGGKPGPWTLYGMVEVTGLKLAPDKVVIDGNRLYVSFKGRERVNHRAPQRVRVEVELTNPAGVQESVVSVLPKALVRNQAELADLVPSFWKKYLLGQGERADSVGGDRKEPSEQARPEAERNEDDCDNAVPGEQSESDARPDRVFRIGGDVPPPACLKCADPKYPGEARKAGAEGAVILWGVLTEQGRMTELQIQKAIGMGLDEAAVEAVQNWEFRAAMRSGAPVAVYMTIEVNFHLFKSR